MGGTDDEAGEHTVTANVTLTSDYVSRGQSQTDRGPAFQGGIDYANESGIFAGLWASSIDFNDPQNSPAEVDLTFGYARDFSDTTNGSVSVAYYWYPDSAPAQYEYLEFIGTLSHEFGGFSVNGEVAYSPDYSSKTGEAVGVTGGIEIPLPVAGDWLSASGHAGYQWVEDNLTYGTPDWFFYDLGLTASFSVFELDVRYTGTDTSDADCFGGTKLCRDGLVVSLTANLPGS